MPEIPSIQNEGPRKEQGPRFDGGPYSIDFLTRKPTDSFIAKTERVLPMVPTDAIPDAHIRDRIKAEENNEPIQFRGSPPKIGLRDVKAVGNELRFNIIDVPFTRYKALNKPEDKDTAREYANPAASSLILRTTEFDGSHQLVVQTRSPKNYPYGDVPGVSVGGYVTKPKNADNNFQINTNTVIQHMATEMDHELGLKMSDISGEGIKLLGLASDNWRIHQEFLLFATTNLSAKQLAKRKGYDIDGHFAETFITIPATIEALETLVTKVQSPLPPTHNAAFVAAGRLMMFEKALQEHLGNEDLAIQLADEWTTKVVEAARQNYQQLAMYNPDKSPTAVGLPGAEEGLEQAGLIQLNEDMDTPENGITHPDKAYLFDVDGVLTNPTAKKVEQEALFDELEKRLARGKPVGLNTGRSLEFMIQQVLEPLETRLKGTHLLQNLFAVGEKGAAWITYGDNDERIIQVDETISVPQDLQAEVRNTVDKGYPLNLATVPTPHATTSQEQQIVRAIESLRQFDGQTIPFNDIMFFDETKRTMVSVEMTKAETDGLIGEEKARVEREHQEKFTQRQKLLASVLTLILYRHGLLGELRIDPTRIATDIENVNVGKALGADRFVELLAVKGIEPDLFVGFGDSPSDYDMFEELQRLGEKAQFVFVGDRQQLAGKPQEGVTYTTQPVDKGTLEYLQQEPN